MRLEASYVFIWKEFWQKFWGEQGKGPLSRRVEMNEEKGCHRI